MTNYSNTSADPVRYFTHPSLPQHRLYEALRAYFVEHQPVTVIAPRFGYKPATLYVATSRWRNELLSPFFTPIRRGPRCQPKKDAAREIVFSLRKKNHSVYDIHRHLKEERGQSDFLAVPLRKGVRVIF